MICYISVNFAQSTEFSPLIPQEIIDNLLNKTYSSQEKELIASDLKNIRELCFRNTTSSQTPTYVATAGGPGACKSTILETYIHNKPNFVYADPDQRTLKFMINTYYQSRTNYHISIQKSYVDMQKNAYNKWRDASNYIANTILNEAYAGSYNIAHGTTSTGSVVELLYQKLQKKNYHIVLLLCFARDDTRKAAVNNMASQGFLQADPDDVINKGKMFIERFPVYFKYGNQIHLYWTYDFTKGSILAATYEKDKGLTVHNAEAYQSFVKEYDEQRKNLNNIPALEEMTKKS